MSMKDGNMVMREARKVMVTSEIGITATFCCGGGGGEGGGGGSVFFCFNEGLAELLVVLVIVVVVVVVGVVRGKEAAKVVFIFNIFLF